MQKRAPTLANILVIVLFALSCFGLLLFLWDSFGGPVPLKPKGYRFTVELSRTLALAEQSDVRIAGVNVGHVDQPGDARQRDDGRDRRNGPSVRPDLLQRPLDPAPEDAAGGDLHRTVPAGRPRVAGRSGGQGQASREPGGSSGRQNVDAVTGHPIPDGGRLASSQVDPAVTLDDILSALDPGRALAFKVWQQSLAAAVNGRGEQINANFAELEPFVENANKLVAILASQEGAVHRGRCTTPACCSTRSPNATTSSAGSSSTASAPSTRSARAAPSGPRLPRAARLRAWRGGDAARIRQPRHRGEPRARRVRTAWERELTPLLEGVQAFTPDFNNLLTNFGPFTSASKKGLPAFERVLRELTPLLGNVTPAAAQLRALPEVHRRIRPRAAGAVRQRHRRHPGARQKRRHDQRPDPALSARAEHRQPRRPRGLQPADRHQPRQPLLQAGRLPAAGQRRAAGIQHRQLRRLRAVAEPAEAPNRDALEKQLG